MILPGAFLGGAKGHVFGRIAIKTIRFPSHQYGKLTER